eukprot:CAMPEP_0178652362 /NCGR_PEP_ID=MMETSP0698-20121128/22601_1 /TAXON_ID=265572 /ORGANISM="Extubocellulus spinifer, Strain CCMP396" /LENGTH=522 /DNA_ID=CAMNT_0020294047 /DNA_START=230 /DNA_END=1796 /DNA_ORIENTATION=+
MPPGTSRERRETNGTGNGNPSLRNKMTPEEMAAAIGPGKLTKSRATYEETSLRLEDLVGEETNVSAVVESSSGHCHAEEEESIRITEDNTMHNSSSIFDTTSVDSMGLSDRDGNDEKPPSSAMHRFLGLFATTRADSNKTAATAITEASSYDASGNIKPHEPARVTFKPSISCRPYISLLDYSPEEYGATWVTEPEKMEAQQEVCITAKMMRRKVKELKRLQEEENVVGVSDGTSSSSQHAALGSSSSSKYTRIEEEPWYIDTPTLTSRGIEHMRTKRDTQRRREHKRSVVEGVLNEQYLQRMESAHDSLGLALTSHEISRESMVVAWGKARGDERHGESERDSFLKRYASAAMRLSQLDAEALASVGNDDEWAQQSPTDAGTGQGDEEHEFNRSTAVSFEKHHALVCEELNELVDEDNDSSIKDRNGSEGGETTTGEDSSQVSIISKMEVCVLDAEVAAGNISADALNIEQSGNNGIGSPPITRTVDAYGNQLLYNPTTQRPTYHFNGVAQLQPQSLDTNG